MAQVAAQTRVDGSAASVPAPGRADRATVAEALTGAGAERSAASSDRWQASSASPLTTHTPERSRQLASGAASEQ